MEATSGDERQSSIEGALASALVRAAQAERWDIVAQIAHELEARRLARQI
jgi:hypothetical protein